MDAVLDALTPADEATLAALADHGVDIRLSIGDELAALADAVAQLIADDHATATQARA